MARVKDDIFDAFSNRSDSMLRGLDNVETTTIAHFSPVWIRMLLKKFNSCGIFLDENDTPRKVYFRNRLDLPLPRLPSLDDVSWSP
jgi:hypothetical protein